MDNRDMRVNVNITKDIISGEWQKVMQKALRWPCGVCGRGTHTPHTHTQPFYNSMDFVRDNPGKPVPEEKFTQTYHGHQSSFTCFIHVLRSMASFLFNLHT